MPPINEGLQIADVLLMELPLRFNRNSETIAAGEGVLKIGTVLGRVTATGKLVASPAASVIGKEGAESASHILLEEVDATAADVKALTLVRGPALINRANLSFEASVDLAAERQAKVDQLESLGIVARQGA